MPLLAALLGAGPVADAFLVAFQLVNVVRRLLTEGGLNAALVPAWLRVRETEGAVAAAAFAGRVLGTVSAALIAATALLGAGDAARDHRAGAGICRPRDAAARGRQCPPDAALSRLCRAGDRDDGAVERARPLCADGVLAAAVQHRADRGHGRAAGCCGRTPAHAAQIIAATVGIAGLLQLSILVLRRGGSIATPLRISFDKEMRGFLGKAVPGMIASSAPQLLMVAGAIIASSSPSAVSWLYFANRLVELPLGIVGVAMGTVLIPELTRARARRRSRRRRACGIARPRTRGRAGAAGDARTDRAERADRAAVVRARRLHRSRYRGDGAGADVAGARPARACAGEGAVAGVFRARGHDDAAVGDAEGSCGGDRARPSCSAIGSAPTASPPRIALGAWSMALSLIRRGAATFGFSIDAAARAAAAAHRRGGAGHGRAAVAGGAVAACARRRARTASCRPSLLLIVIAAESRFTACFCGFSASPAGAKRLTRSGKQAPADLRD